jgi:hypothetical protein
LIINVNDRCGSGYVRFPTDPAIHGEVVKVAQGAHARSDRRASRRPGWTVGITSEDLVGAQSRAVIGLGLAKDDAPEDARAHQAAMECVPDFRWVC